MEMDKLGKACRIIAILLGIILIVFGIVMLNLNEIVEGCNEVVFGAFVITINIIELCCSRN